MTAERSERTRGEREVASSIPRLNQTRFFPYVWSGHKLVLITIIYRSGLAVVLPNRLRHLPPCVDTYKTIWSLSGRRVRQCSFSHVPNSFLTRQRCGSESLFEPRRFTHEGRYRFRSEWKRFYFHTSNEIRDTPESVDVEIVPKSSRLHWIPKTVGECLFSFRLMSSLPYVSSSHSYR